MDDFDFVQEQAVNPSTYMERARKFIAANLRECCAELIEWDQTAVLSPGRVREATRIYRNVSSTSALSMVRSEVALQAMTHISEKGLK